MAGNMPDEEEYEEVKVWNPTVANLTLMALGSSAPEILLSIIEIIGNGFRAGDLGPGTIVGKKYSTCVVERTEYKKRYKL
ncbi:unnamed protein product [Cylicostephanus goldi]|uniref:Sodium/calcium exchanger membrane region domain-containing protein n=1 Tax=Cylicostephanus goldi TaxID=71465 RepID=A0A3P7P6E2_CYLGO|nr:unnamed protein product [Cylicostephanus goldi]